MRWSLREAADCSALRSINAMSKSRGRRCAVAATRLPYDLLAGLVDLDVPTSQVATSVVAIRQLQREDVVAARVAGIRDVGLVSAGLAVRLRRPVDLPRRRIDRRVPRTAGSSHARPAR